MSSWITIKRNGQISTFCNFTLDAAMRDCFQTSVVTMFPTSRDGRSVTTAAPPEIGNDSSSLVIWSSLVGLHVKDTNGYLL